MTASTVTETEKNPAMRTTNEHTREPSVEDFSENVSKRPPTTSLRLISSAGSSGTRVRDARRVRSFLRTTRRPRTRRFFRGRFVVADHLTDDASSPR